MGGGGLLAVAFSGGADSTLLLATALAARPGRVLALHAHSILQPPADRGWAETVARGLGAAVTAIRTSPLDWPELVANPADRCYHCKRRLYQAFLAHLAGAGGGSLVDGTNADDTRETRPGRRALAELGVGTPLATATLTKAEVREASRLLGLVTWNRPAGSCLATRLASGLAVTRERLALVAELEAVLKACAIGDCRVRLVADAACRIEITAGDFPRIADPAWRRSVVTRFDALGVQEVTVNLAARDTC
ncbi:MAG: TIGR00268 family protein [Thermodesulfobacteriota bacterium]